MYTNLRKSALCSVWESIQENRIYMDVIIVAICT